MDSITNNMTNNASYNQVQYKVESDDHYAIPDPLRRPPLEIPSPSVSLQRRPLPLPNTYTDNTIVVNHDTLRNRKPDDDEEYIKMIDNPAHDVAEANNGGSSVPGSEVVLYI